MVWKVIIVILLITVAALAALYYFGNRMQKRQVEAEQQMEAMKQTVSMLVIDKKLMKLKDSGLPQQVIDQQPWYSRRAKMPIVKAKVGPRVMTMVADRAVFDVLPVKAEVKVVISGIYISAIKSVRGGSIKPLPKKKTVWERVKGVFSRS